MTDSEDRGESAVETSEDLPVDEHDAPLASPQHRLAAVCLEAALSLAPVFVLLPISRLLGSSKLMLGSALIQAIVLLCLLVLNLVWLSRYGQTVGKRLMGLRIVRSDGRRASLAMLLFARYLAPGVLGAIPFLGPVFAIVDAAMIFTDGRRTLHDRFADTIVIDVR